MLSELVSASGWNMEMFEKVFVTLIIFECTTKDVDASHIIAANMPIDPVRLVPSFLFPRVPPRSQYSFLGHTFRQSRAVNLHISLSEAD
jgi:hypothetical protein